MGKKLTQEEFAKLFNVTRQTVSNWENEKSKSDKLIQKGLFGLCIFILIALIAIRDYRSYS